MFTSFIFFAVISNFALSFAFADECRDPHNPACEEKPIKAPERPIVPKKPITDRKLVQLSLHKDGWYKNLCIDSEFCSSDIEKKVEAMVAFHSTELCYDDSINGYLYVSEIKPELDAGDLYYKVSIQNRRNKDFSAELSLFLGEIYHYNVMRPDFYSAKILKSTCF